MAQVDIHVKVSPEVKSKAEEVLNQIGVSMSTYINMSLRTVARERRIPFNTEIPLAPPDLIVDSEEEMLKRIDEGLDYDEAHPETFTSEEILADLGIKA